MITRYLSSAAAGLAVTITLLWVMQYLVEIAEPAENPPRPGGLLEWVLVKEDTPVVTTRNRTKPIPAPVPTPDPRPPVDPQGPVTPIGLPVSPAPPTGPTFKTGTPGFVDGALVSIVHVQPEYPLGAAAQGLEGFVIVSFDVSASGTVENVSIVESSDRIFNRAAIRAASRARYKPRIVDGVPQRSVAVQKRFRFAMDDKRK